MSGEYRARETRANIVIVPTTSSFELEPPQREQSRRKRASLHSLTCQAAAERGSAAHASALPECAPGVTLWLLQAAASQLEGPSRLTVATHPKTT